MIESFWFSGRTWYSVWKTVWFSCKTFNCSCIDWNVCELLLLGENSIEKESFGTYLGKKIDEELAFIDHIYDIVEKTPKHLSVIARLMHKVSRFFLLRSYTVYVKSVAHYGLLVYVCTSKTVPRPISSLQKKILMLIYFKEQRSTTEDLFELSEVLSIYNLYTVDLLKFVILAIRSKCPKEQQNSFFRIKLSTSLMAWNIKTGF